MNINVKVGLVLKTARQKLGINYSVLAMKTGLSNSSISRIERGDFGLTLETSSLLFLALEVPLSEMYQQIMGKEIEIDFIDFSNVLPINGTYLCPVEIFILLVDIKQG